MNKGKKIAEGGMLLALYSILLFITIHIPFLGMITFFLLPIPFVLVMIKESISWSIGFLAVASVLGIIIGTILSLPTVLLTGVMGIVIGYHVKHNKSTIQMFISSVLAFIVGSLLILIATNIILDMNVVDETLTMVEESMETSFDMMDMLGQNVTDDMKQQMRDSIEMIPMMIPSMLVISAMVMAYIFILASQPFIKRFSDKVVKWPLFRELRLPKSILWYYLIILVATFFMNTDDHSYVNMAILNLMFILQLFILLQGFSLIFYISYVKGWGKFVPILITVVSLLNPIFLTIVRILGIIDLGFPFREAITKSK
ncbi:MULTISPECIES: YybS family protein [Peribacillus]|uniref:YybS family protein n=1 Tax=Peribacillus TaxID=2675229 RepID=UPI002079B7F1|nr:YybS family protein [Peribacillus asahii]USK70310.1 YybS family protein [Peribacillus asahii]